MDFRPGLPIRLMPRTQAQRSYSHRDGITRETAFDHTLDGVRTRLDGVRVGLGDNPYAKELVSLGLVQLGKPCTDNIRRRPGDLMILPALKTNPTST